MKTHGHTLELLLSAASVIFLILITYSFWPGIATPDSITTYVSAVAGRYDDWSPVLMQLIWSGLPKQPPGGAMLVFNVALFAFGWFLWGASLLRVGGRWAVLIFLASLAPGTMFCIGYLWRDVMLAGFLLCSSGALALFERRRRVGTDRTANDFALLAFAIITGILGASSRTNGLFAFLPLALFAAVLLRKGMVVGVVAFILMAAAPVALNSALFRFFDAERLYPENSLFVFDLGALSNGVENKFPGTWTPEEAAAINATCYFPYAWDNYKWGNCEFVSRNLTSQGFWGPQLKSIWLSEVLANPVRYVRHRLRFMASMIMPPLKPLKEPYPNAYGLDFQPGAASRLVTTLSETGRWSPISIFLVSPVAWLFYGILTLYFSHKLAARSLRAVTYALLSGLAYAGAYVVIGVGNDYRYFHWTFAIGATCALYVLISWAAQRRAVNPAVPGRRAIK